MKIEKAQWSADSDNNVRIAMPLTKINEEKRQVSGFASLDNHDSHDDVVLAEASDRAFTRFRGNIREMHQPIAVGRMVNFSQEDYIDTETGEVYKGIYVTVRVSKGAQDTWEKVLDGTLSGFSIGGNIVDAESQFVKDANKNIRFIKDYELTELSLVDNPANQLANVFSIEKNADGTSFMKGMIAETKSENVFICVEDEIAKTSSVEALECPACGNPMTNKGWFEYATEVEKKKKAAEAVQKYLSSSNTQDSPANDEGGVDMAKDTVEKDAGSGEVVPDETEVVEQGKAESEAESSVEEVSDEDSGAEATDVEEAVDVSEVEDEEEDLVKRLDALREDLNKAIEDGFVKFSDGIDDVNNRFESFTTNVETKFKGLEQRYGELTEKFAGLKGQIDSVEKSVGMLDGETAFRKSGSLGGESEGVVKKKATVDWGNHFLSAESLKD